MRIPIYRAAEAVDEYGDPRPVGPVDTWPEVLEIEGRHAPANPAEPLAVGRNTVIAGGTVYSRDLAARNVLPTDAVGIGGVRYMVDGQVGVWSEVGVQFAVKAVS